MKNFIIFFIFCIICFLIFIFWKSTPTKNGFNINLPTRKTIKDNSVPSVLRFTTPFDKKEERTKGEDFVEKKNAFFKKEKNAKKYIK